MAELVQAVELTLRKVRLPSRLLGGAVPLKECLLPASVCDVSGVIDGYERVARVLGRGAAAPGEPQSGSLWLCDCSDVVCPCSDAADGLAGGCLSCSEEPPVSCSAQLRVPCSEEPPVSCASAPPVPCSEEPHVSCSEEPPVSCSREPPVSCSEEPPVPCSEEPAAPCSEEPSVLTAPQAALVQHMQRRLGGVCLAMLYLIQDTVCAFLGPDDAGNLTGGVKEHVARLHRVAARFLCVLGRISTHKRLRQIASLRSSGAFSAQPKGYACVYGRVTLATHDLYIGRTEDFSRRHGEHLYETHRHSHSAQKPCRGCRDHSKYRRHRTAEPSAWFMIPLIWVRRSPKESEVKRVERAVIRRLHPNINRPERPFWLLKDLYTSAYRETTRRHRHAKSTCPWPRPPSERSSLPPFTVFVWRGDVYHTAGAVFGRLVEHGGREAVAVYPGLRDLSRWGRVKRTYGSSHITVVGDGWSGRLRDWLPAGRSAVTILVRAERDMEVQEHVWRDISTLRDRLADGDEDFVAFMWRIRASLSEQHPTVNVYKLLWSAICDRYPDVPRRPIRVRIPFFHALDPTAIRKAIASCIATQAWPAFLRQWHVQNLRIVTVTQPSIESILCNVNMPWRPKGECSCRLVRSAVPAFTFPQVDGHIFFTSREYEGPFGFALKVSGCNTPQQTLWDIARAWHTIPQQLPEVLRPSAGSWRAALRAAVKPSIARHAFPTTRDVYRLRKLLRPLVCGQLDRNLHELWFCCPVLYERAWHKLFSPTTGYERVYPRKWTAATRAEPESIVSTIPPAKRSAGSTRDVIAAWAALYRELKWSRFASFDSKGGFNVPYVIFKAKNVTDPLDRVSKWHKARPIAPATKHPMRRLFHLTGRAWSFIASHLASDNFVLTKCSDVPRVLSEAQRALAGHGPIECTTRDITGCFPSMPKEAIALGMTSEVHKLEHLGYGGVQVPRAASRPCSFRRTRAAGTVWFPFEDLVSIMLFALHHTMLLDLQGGLWVQRRGIPMGDPHSPGMAIVTCAWMEDEWLQTVGAEARRLFRCYRYMDDILTIHPVDSILASSALARDLQRECYWPPLELEDGRQGTFLETSFDTSDDGVRFWLKNDNVRGAAPKVWRYAHFWSYTSLTQKRATLRAALRKVHTHASDDSVLFHSAQKKLAEFDRLLYPQRMLRQACCMLAVTTRNTVWFRVRDALVDE